MIDKFALVAILACAYPALISPLLVYLTTTTIAGDSVEVALQNMMAPRLENKIFWPALSLIAIMLALRNWSRLTFPPHIICLGAYLGLAGLSTLWAFKPEISLQRFIVQVMILSSVVLPTILAARTADTMRGLFLCFGFACIINMPIVATQTPIILDGVAIGYAGYFSFKGLLGQCAAIAFLLALYEMLHPGRRAMGLLVLALATALLLLSKNKGSLGMALIAPTLAAFTLLGRRLTGISPPFLLLPIPIGYWVLSKMLGSLISRISWHTHGNFSLSGRIYIWDFAGSQVALRPLLGWGYQSFWLVGSDGPSVVSAPGWIKTMPNGHNGYLDTVIEMGYVGLVVLLVFIFATLHAIGRVADHDVRRAWLLLTIALFLILTNCLESTWMRGMDMLWLIFAIIAAEAARYWQPNRSGNPQHPSRAANRRHPMRGRIPQAVSAGGRR